MSTVHLSEISLKYDGDMVLEGINLSIDEGQYVVVLGASGCGKTSLLRMIAGLVRPTLGKIVLFGKVVNDVEPRHRNLAMLPQQAGLYPHLTIGKTIAMGIRESLSKVDRDKRVLDAAKLVEMDGFLDRYPEQLSGGQQRRAAVAKAIASQSPVRLLDEPLSAIDANLRFQIEKDLRRLHQQLPGVTIHVTHDGAEAIRLADRIAVIEHGKISQYDTPDRLQRHPATPGVAAALGHSPLITVPMRHDETTWRAPSGQSIAGPDGTKDATATLAYYEADAITPGDRPPDDKHQVETGDWVDASPDGLATVMVRRKDLFWFVD